MLTKSEIRSAIIMSGVIVLTGVFMHMMAEYSFIQKATAGYGK